MAESIKQSMLSLLFVGVARGSTTGTMLAPENGLIVGGIIGTCVLGFIWIGFNLFRGLINFFRKLRTTTLLFILPCPKGHTVNLKHNFSNDFCNSSCQLLEGKCRRRRHVRCYQCGEIFHFPHDDEKKLIVLPKNRKSMDKLVSVKSDTRKELAMSCKKIADVIRAINNELKILRDCLKSVTDAYNIRADSESNKMIITRPNVKDIDDKVMQRKPDIIKKINNLQEIYLTHVDNVQDYWSRTAITALVRRKVKFLKCKGGIISKAEEISQIFKKDLNARREEIDNLYITSFDRIVKYSNDNLKEEIQIILQNSQIL